MPIILSNIVKIEGFHYVSWFELVFCIIYILFICIFTNQIKQVHYYYITIYELTKNNTVILLYGDKLKYNNV